MAFLAVLVAGCSNKLEPVDSGVTGDDTNNGDDTTSGDDTDTQDTHTGGDDTDTNDTDTNDTTDTGTGHTGDTNVDCTADYSANMDPTPDQCITQTISCGDTILGTTEGGTTFYDYDDYGPSAWMCKGPWESTDYTAPERVFEMILPAGKYGTVVLDAPCGDLTLRKVYAPNACDSSSGACQAPTSSYIVGDTQTIKDFYGNATQDKRFELIVDGLDGTTGNFQLAVTCY